MTTQFTTLTECVNFLVAQGKPLNRAKVAVNESLNYDHPNDQLAHDFDSKNGDLNPCSISESDLLQTYNDMCGLEQDHAAYFTEGSDGFYFEDGTLMYDLNGDPIKD